MHDGQDAGTDGSDSVSREFVSTLHEIAGYEVTEHYGMVGTVVSNLGEDAQSQGLESTQKALRNIRREAAKRGANAILGLQVGPFSTYGADSGNSIGVVLIGTAVTIREVHRRT